MRRALDWKLLLVSLAAVAAGGFLRRMTKSQASYWYLCIAATACFFFVLALNGWRDLEDHLRAGTFLLFATSMIALGFMVELRNRPLDGRPFYVLGFLLLSAAWYVYAISGYPVLHIGSPPEREQVQLSFIIGGVISFFLGYAAQRAGTPLLSRYSTVPYLVAPSCVLVSLSFLVAQEIRLYEVLLPVACLTFVVLSVAVQRKNLLYSGAAYISVAVFQITYNHFTDKWWWPLTLLLAGGALAAGSLVTGKIATRIKRKADGRATQS